MYGVAENLWVVQPCQRAVCHTIERVVTMIPNRNERSEERLGMKVLQQIISPYSARTEKVFHEFAEIFFQPSVEAHEGYCGNRISQSLTRRDITGNSESFQEAFRGKVTPTAVDTMLNLIKKVDDATEVPLFPTAQLLSKANVLFGISENEQLKPSKMWGGVADESTFRNTLWESLAFAFTNSDGPYADLRYMKAEEVTLEDAERALMPYLSDLPKPFVVPETQDEDEEFSDT